MLVMYDSYFDKAVVEYYVPMLVMSGSYFDKAKYICLHLCKPFPHV